MATTNPIKRNLLFRIDAQHRLLIAVIVGAIVFTVAYPSLTPPELALTTWIGAALTIILLNWITILGTHPREVKKIAKLQDSSRALLFGFIITAAVVSLVAIIFLLKESKSLSEVQRNGHILLAIAAVFVSWWLVHTIFSLRYAHLYYDVDTDDGGTRQGGGLDFPDTKEPDYLDFMYFGFVVGMTFQVSDVVITSRRLRRLCLLHALIAFAFNTAIVALSINVISGMVSQ
jgi:uncharacterized membrane protein